MSIQALLTPLRMGDLDLPNRVVMAPLTRMRAEPISHVPTELQVEYYVQRASAGLIIAEATAISPDGFGWADTPGIWSKEQIHGWRRVTDAVHKAGGRIISQLWHIGAISHPDLRGGLLPVSASDIDPGQIAVTSTDGNRLRASTATESEIKITVEDFKRAAQNAMEAEFDRVQLLANYLLNLPVFEHDDEPSNRPVRRQHREPDTFAI